MNNKLNYVVFNILTVVAYFYGVLLCATLILIPVGVYSVIAAHRYSAFADMSAADAAIRKQSRTGWIIFGCVLYFPIGLIGLLGLLSTSNNISVSDVTQQDATYTVTASEPQVDNVGQTTEVEVSQPINAAERAEKLEKLKRFKQQGLITADEYEQAVGQLNDKQQ